MLRPPTEIFIAHRDKSAEFKSVQASIRRVKSAGYRVTPIYVNEETLRDDNVVPLKVFESLDRSEAAIVIFSPDLRLVTEQAKRFPSQAATYEYGYLSAKFGNKRDDLIKLIGPDTVSIQSYRPDIRLIDLPENKKDLDQWMADFFRRLNVPKGHDLLFADDYRIQIQSGDLGTLGMTEHDVRQKFKDELTRIDGVQDRLVFIYERIFTDVYFEDKYFWPSIVKEIASEEHDEKILDPLHALEAILHYTSGPWRQKKVHGDPMLEEDTDALKRNYIKLKEVGLRIFGYGYNPIVKLTINNYLGLYLSREELKGISDVTKKTESYSNFIAAKRIAEQYEDPPMRLWCGFIDYNLARNLIKQGVSNPEQLGRLRAALRTAKEHRYFWSNNSLNNPLFLQDIFTIEYFEAFRLLVASDIDEKYVSEFEVALETWVASSQGRRYSRAIDMYHERRIRG